MRTLSRKASFWVATSVAGVGLWTSSAPSLTYPLYAAEWGLDKTITTAIFAVFPVALVLVLVVFGNLADFIGPRASILCGLAASCIGTVGFAVAPDVAWVFVGRALMGVGVGLSMGPATAAMVELSAPGQSQRASSINTAATSVGVVLAALVGGALIQYAPFPTRLNFWVLGAVLAALGIAAWFLPRTTAGGQRGRWKPRPPQIPRGARWVFVVSLFAVSGGYAIGALTFSLGAQIAKELIGSDNALISGASIAVFAITIGVVALIWRGLPVRRMIILGGVAAILGLALLLYSAVAQSIGGFFLASVFLGAGYSFLFLGGLSLLTERTPANRLAATLSAMYLVAYLAQGVTALGLGAIATASGLSFAIEIGAPVLAIVAVTALVLASTVRARRVGSPERADAIGRVVG